MIISASYKTDIPTFYGEWFINRLRAGYCKVINPYNRKPFRVDLSHNTVDGFIFWTKNIGPFLKYLAEIREREFPFMVQHTINGYPRSLEFSVVDADRAAEHMKQISDTYGSKVVVWRYDTIVFSSVTSIDFHRGNFSRLAKLLEGTTDEVVVSFAQIYKKTRRNMDWASENLGFTWEDPPNSIKFALASELAQIAKSYGMQLTMCAQKEFLAPHVMEAHCVDAKRLSEIAGRPIVSELKGNRPDCSCFTSKDIGDYDTCPHGCVYCYAVQNRALAQRRFKEHDPSSDFLFAPQGYENEIENQPTLL
jgi:Domain of unknown function (DUF1848)